MSELSPQGQALLRATRAALRPQSADRERILASLQSRLGAPVTGAAAKAVATQAGTLWTVAGAAFVGVGGVVAFGLSSLSTPAPAPTVAPAASVSTPAVPEAQVAPQVTSEAEPVSPVAPPALSALTRRDRLAEEVAILSQAAKDLRAGRAASALSALNAHQKKFPNGLMAQERRAARAEALCSLGRFSEADAELASLVRTAPGSPLTVRAQQRCKARPATSH